MLKYNVFLTEIFLNGYQVHLLMHWWFFLSFNPVRRKMLLFVMIWPQKQPKQYLGMNKTTPKANTAQYGKRKGNGRYSFPRPKVNFNKKGNCHYCGKSGNYERICTKKIADENFKNKNGQVNHGGTRKKNGIGSNWNRKGNNGSWNKDGNNNSWIRNSSNDYRNDASTPDA